MSDHETIDPDGAFRADVATSLLCDPYPSLERLAALVGLPAEQVVHYALYRWVASGAETLLSATPDVVRRLAEAADAGDLAAVRGIVSSLQAAPDGRWR